MDTDSNGNGNGNGNGRSSGGARRVAFLLGSDFEDSEFETPRTTLMELGHHIDVIGIDAGEELIGKEGHITATTDLAVDAADHASYDVVVVPGGYSPDHLRVSDGIVRFLRDAANAGTPIAAICHAGSLLIEAGLVDGRRVTSWPSIRTDLENAGAHWVDEDVVFDGPLITSRDPDDLPAFTEAIVGALGGSATH